MFGSPLSRKSNFGGSPATIPNKTPLGLKLTLKQQIGGVGEDAAEKSNGLSQESFAETKRQSSEKLDELIDDILRDPTDNNDFKAQEDYRNTTSKRNDELALRNRVKQDSSNEPTSHPLR